MEPNTRLAHAGYVVAAYLGVAPLVDAVLPYVPPHFGDARWLFTLFGVISNVILIPLLALFVGLVISRFDVRRRGPARAISVLAMVFAAVLAVGVVVFAISYLDVNRVADPRARHTLATMSATAMVKYCAGIAGAVLTAYAARAMSVNARVVREEPVARTGR